RSRRSAAVTLGKSQYIIPMPEGNHTRNNRHNPTPSHRWTKIATRLIILVRSLTLNHENTKTRNTRKRSKPTIHTRPGDQAEKTICVRSVIVAHSVTGSASFRGAALLALRKAPRRAQALRHFGTP